MPTGDGSTPVSNILNGLLPTSAHGTPRSGSGTENCYDGNEWTSACSGESDCTSKCVLEGADYSKTYGVSTSGNQLSLTFMTEHEYGTNIGSRLYLMQNTDNYVSFTLNNNELAFDVDLSTVECGLNSALYFVAMEIDGGKKSYSTNTAGAKYGTGYCDAQCARDLKFVGGKVSPIISSTVSSSCDRALSILKGQR